MPGSPAEYPSGAEKKAKPASCEGGLLIDYVRAGAGTSTSTSIPFETRHQTQRIDRRSTRNSIIFEQTCRTTFSQRRVQSRHAIAVSRIGTSKWTVGEA